MPHRQVGKPNEQPPVGPICDVLVITSPSRNGPNGSGRSTGRGRGGRRVAGGAGGGEKLDFFEVEISVKIHLPAHTFSPSPKKGPQKADREEHFEPTSLAKSSAVIRHTKRRMKRWERAGSAALCTAWMLMNPGITSQLVSEELQARLWLKRDERSPA